MFWKNLKLKVLKSKRHIGINLVPTSSCDTGCLHCMDNCHNNNPVHFSKELTKKIINEAGLEMWKLSVLFTGGGEPLLAPDFLKIADLFASYERIGYIDLITSGFTNDEHERREKLKDLLRRPYAKNVLIDQSFNLYHESFPERLSNMARAILEVQGRGNFRVRACMSMENATKTQLLIEKTIKDLANELQGIYVPFILGEHKADRSRFKVFENKYTDDETALRLHLEMSVTPQWHGIRTKNGGVAIHVIPISFEQTGRGNKINETPFANSLCGSFIADIEDTYMWIMPDGHVFPECSCPPDNHMSLGKIGQDSLVDLVKRKDIFFERIFEEILGDNRMFEWGTNDVCKVCKQIVAHKGMHLK